MLYQIKRKETGKYINLLNLNNDIFFLNDTAFLTKAIGYDIFEIQKASIFLKRFNIDFEITEFKFKTIGKNLKQQNGTILKRMVCSKNGQTNIVNNLELDSRTKISKRQRTVISNNKGIFKR
jgi:hypothetical protein